MLEIKNLTCGYRQFSLKEINLKLPGEEVIGIIGPNGSGKTTLLKAIAGVMPLISGQIVFEGQDVGQISRKNVAQSIAVVSQDAQIPMDISVKEFVGLGRIPHQSRFQFFDSKKDEEAVITALEETGVIHLKDRLLGNLSGGERQLVVIAKALAQEPKLLLLDEPTVFLDIAHQAEIMDLIKRLNKKNSLSVIIVLHELNLASDYCDRILLLNNGTVSRMGTPQEVLDYKIIEDVYKTTVVVQNNPVSGKPYVYIVPETVKRKGSRP
ncbi:MAG: ABC transporter ATP-binding protein [Candidatus Omnitrophota bacterium]